ncbi:hypothetical protein AXK56_06505 [Tsukamurella pulmonis]|uniref:Uncharacterized protein n=1 Tax=Tsukamurella pulmonis TaxID=47312 RepID=A0A1H1CPX9_9ACTN|nr:hypothetical protein [Tsukamurella pulmonis]KXO89806.1 hypothetical protein AXK56_06505 [Tsukamurella pulmonis]SDQ66311.1 hypothetical protein SAMN04489765_1319 [Tsukamurella pulmonis]SUP23335.1 Uncharacterised protein [Tsukamurella pulmonis]
MQPNHLAPWHRRHPVAVVVLTVVTAVLIVVTVTLAVVIGLFVMLAHALSDPIPVDRRDAATVRERVEMYGLAVDKGWELTGSQCNRLRDAEPGEKWFPPGPRYAGSVRIDGDDATVVVSSSPTPATAQMVSSLAFRYESGAWRYCGVS